MSTEMKVTPAGGSTFETFGVPDAEELKARASSALPFATPDAPSYHAAPGPDAFESPSRAARTHLFMGILLIGLRPGPSP